MTEASNERPIEWARGNADRRCVATNNKTGERCRNWAIRGGAVCRYHGGSTGHVKAKARERIERALDLMAMELLGIATGAESESVRLAAIRDALDRGGITAKAALEVSAATSEPKPYEELLSGITGIATISRVESRARRGLPAPDTPALPPPAATPAPDVEIIDAELLSETPTGTAHSPPDGLTPAEGRRVPSGHPSTPAGPPTGLVSFEEAVTETRVRQVRRVTRQYR